MALANPQAFQFVSQIGFKKPNDLMSYQEPNTTTAGDGLKTVLSIPQSSTGNAINLATLFPALASVSVIAVKDISATPTNLGFSPNSTGTRMTLRGGTPLTYGTTGAPPTLYFDNATGAAAQVEIVVIGS